MSVFTMNWWWCTTSATISNRNSQCEFIVCGWQEKCVSLYIWLFIWSEVIRMTNQNLAHGLVVHKWQQGKNIAQFQMQCNTFEFEPLIHSKCIWNQHTHTNTHFGCDEYYTSLLSSTLLKTYEDDSMWCMCNFSNWNMWIARLIGAQQQLDKCAKKLLIICKCEKWPRCNAVPNWISMRINDDHDVTVSQQPLILTICGRIMPKKWFLCFHWCQPLR